MAGLRNKADPTGQAKNRRKTISTVNRKLRTIGKEALSIFEGIPRIKKVIKDAKNNSVQVNSILWEYNFSQEELTALANALGIVADRELLEGLVATDSWWFAEYLELPYRQGTLNQARDLNQDFKSAQTAGLVAPSTIFGDSFDTGVLLLTSNYRKNLQMTYATNFEAIKSVSKRTASRIFEQIRKGILSGANPTTIRRDITKAISVSASDAQRIAVTEVNAAYNNAKLDTSILVREQYDLNNGVLHVSALTSTTRIDHANRHGEAFTPETQRIWWNTGVNRINCKCSVRAVILDKDNKPINSQLQKETIKEAKEFFK